MDLTTTAGIQLYLQDTPFAAHTIQVLSGGMSNFTYRIYLHTPLDGQSTFILKYAAPYVAVSAGKFPLDQKRQVFALSHGLM
jgi:5-methylthioribose kinase